MHKKLVLICFLLLLSGCTRVQENDNYIESVQNCLDDYSVTNEVSLGYQYYVPKGVRKIRDYDYNQVFLVDNTYMYLYVDIISYFYDRELVVKKNSDDDYYQEFNHQGKRGYLRIVKEDDDRYFVGILYHYSKIECYVEKEKLTKVISLASIILNSVKYQDTIIEKVLEGDLGKFSEFTYEIDKPDGASNNFSQFLEEYVQSEEETEKLPDE